MPHNTLRAVSIATVAFAALIHFSSAQTPPSAPQKPLMLITWFDPGAIALPAGQDWKPELLTVYDKDRRPVAQFSKGNTGLNASFIIFENLSGTPTAHGCRQDVIEPLVKNEGKLVSKRTDSEFKSSANEAFATTSYQLDMSLGGIHHPQRNLFAFAGNAKTCAEIHLSTVHDSPADEAAMTALLADFHPDLNYQPIAPDYFRLASLLFKNAPGNAAPYYKSALDALPNDASAITARRVITDQLVMALGMSGDLKNSRAVAQQAITADPDYPLNYYNLACADAEAGNPTDARTHLQQAFDRRANVIKGETLPDPTKDDSILKLKKDKAFWTFVEALPKN